jgi:hypothetical protein
MSPAQMMEYDDGMQMEDLGMMVCICIYMYIYVQIHIYIYIYIHEYRLITIEINRKLYGKEFMIRVTAI